MYDDEDDDLLYDDETPDWSQANRLRWWDIAPVVLSLPVAIAKAGVRWGEQVCVLLAGHAAYRDEAERSRFEPIKVSAR